MEEKGCTNWRDYFRTPTGNNNNQRRKWLIPEEELRKERVDIFIYFDCLRVEFEGQTIVEYPCHHDKQKKKVTRIPHSIAASLSLIIEEWVTLDSNCPNCYEKDILAMGSRLTLW